MSVTVLSLGAGVRSTTLLLMAVRGELEQAAMALAAWMSEPRGYRKDALEALSGDWWCERG